MKNKLSSLVIIVSIIVSVFTLSCEKDQNNKKPKALFSADNTDVEIGEAVQFSYLYSGSAINWIWDFGDGNTSIKKNPIHYYNEEGIYTVSLTITNTAGSDTETKTDYIKIRGLDLLIDYDGNTYEIIALGSQVWMKENLKTTHYPDGTPIPFVTDGADWEALEDNNTDDAFCINSNLEENAEIYGALYTYAAALNACPTGWHLPTDEEWKTLEMFLGMSQSEADREGGRGTNQGSQLAGNRELWLYEYYIEDNTYFEKSGFNGLPAGWRFLTNGAYLEGGIGSVWWSATEYDTANTFTRGLIYSSSKISRHYGQKSHGFSVRCIKDK